MRSENRTWDQSRAVSIEPDFLRTSDGSAIASFGRTRVLCAASIESKQPRWMTGQPGGWLTAEYAMMPASTRPRAQRDRNHVGGRTHEIQRLIGRSLRQAVDLVALGPRTLYVDCDVLEADGGTRTTAITGAWVAAAVLIARLTEAGQIQSSPLIRQIASVSVGVVDGEPVVDLDYLEDVRAEVDMNIVLTSGGELVELQGTAESRPFSRAMLGRLLDGAERALQPIFEAQRTAVAAALAQRPSVGEIPEG